jgi:hypothetical protein
MSANDPNAPLLDHQQNLTAGRLAAPLARELRSAALVEPSGGCTGIVGAAACGTTDDGEVGIVLLGPGVRAGVR